MLRRTTFSVLTGLLVGCSTSGSSQLPSHPPPDASPDVVDEPDAAFDAENEPQPPEADSTVDIDATDEPDAQIEADDGAADVQTNDGTADAVDVGTGDLPPDDAGAADVSPDVAVEASKDASDAPLDGSDAGSCGNAMVDGQETDIDCGGPACTPCDVDRLCRTGRDCKTSYCPRGICELASAPPYWLPGVPLTTPRAYIAVVVWPAGVGQGKIFVIGGQSAATPAVNLDDYETFDMQTSSWTVEKLPGPRVSNSAALGPEGKIYLFGYPKEATWTYDGSWSTSLAPVPAGCSYVSAALGSDGILYTPCGHPNASNIVDTYRPQEDAWSTVPQPGPNDIVSPAAVSLGGRIYIIGGVAPNASFEAYDIATKTWSSPAPLFDRNTTCAVVGPDRRIYAVGGHTSQGETALVSAYSPESNRWAPMAPLGVPRYLHGVATGPDGRIYAIGGISGSFAYKATTNVEVYGPVVSASPSVASPGASVFVNGHNFAANATVSVHLGSTAGPVLGTAKTNAGGTLSPFVSFAAPNTTGDGYLTIMDDKSRFPVTIPFTVR